MTYVHHPRTAWQETGYPITGPAPKQRATTAVLHYSGSDNIPDNIPQWLRSMQRDYTNNRGYSLGYWQLVDQTGNAWQIRGPHGTTPVYNSAANKGDKVSGNANDWTYPILLAVRTNEPASDAAIATCRALWNEWDITTRPIPHSDLDYTSCCGDPVRTQILLGHFDNTQPQPPPPGDLPMRYYALPPNDTGNRPHLVVWDGAVRYRANPDNDPLPAHRLNEEQYQYMLKSAGLA